MRMCHFRPPIPCGPYIFMYLCLPSLTPLNDSHTVVSLALSPMRWGRSSDRGWGWGGAAGGPPPGARLRAGGPVGRLNACKLHALRRLNARVKTTPVVLTPVIYTRKDVPRAPLPQHRPKLRRAQNRLSSPEEGGGFRADTRTRCVCFL